MKIKLPDALDQITSPGYLLYLVSWQDRDGLRFIVPAMSKPKLAAGHCMPYIDGCSELMASFGLTSPNVEEFTVGPIQGEEPKTLTRAVIMMPHQIFGSIFLLSSREELERVIDAKLNAKAQQS